MSFVCACLATVAVETAFFAAVGYRDRDFIIVCVCVNVATNLSLNLILWWLFSLGVNTTVAVYPLELAVLFAEYAAYSALRRPSAKLFWLTFGANLLSYIFGIALFGHV